MSIGFGRRSCALRMFGLPKWGFGQWSAVARAQNFKSGGCFPIEQDLSEYDLSNCFPQKNDSRVGACGMPLDAAEVRSGTCQDHTNLAAELMACKSRS